MGVREVEVSPGCFRGAVGPDLFETPDRPESLPAGVEGLDIRSGEASVAAWSKRHGYFARIRPAAQSCGMDAEELGRVPEGHETAVGCRTAGESEVLRHRIYTNLCTCSRGYKRSLGRRDTCRPKAT